MNKLCCCLEPDLPSITFNINCACCESRVEEREDSPDFDMAIQETNEQRKEASEAEEDKEDETTTCCCCFRRKRHAKPKKKNVKKTCHGRET